MKPTSILHRGTLPDGATVVLSHHDGHYRLSLDGQELMSSRQHGSEQALAHLALSALGYHQSPRILVGGLGFGYTLRSALDRLPPGAQVIVAEILPFLVEAHSGELGALAGRPLSDPRVKVEVGDVRQLLGKRDRFDAILLDVDNGPRAFTLSSNAKLYSPKGLALLYRSLEPDGLLAVWSAEPSPEFLARLLEAGFFAHAEKVAGREGARKRHVVFLGRAGRIRE